MHILVIHSAGNVNSNPNLQAIIELLVKNGFIVDYLCFDNSRMFYQEKCFDNVNIIKINNKSSKSVLISYLKEKLQNRYCLIIGIHDAIEAAAVLANKWAVPYILLSYEILFADECNVQKKEQEIRACSGVSMALCQDPVRSFLLSMENQIPLAKIINIPVASKYNGPYKKSNFLKEKFHIDQEKKIALLAGTLSSRNMVGEIIKQVHRWPENWVMILHSFIGISKSEAVLLNRISNKIVVSDTPFNMIDDLEKLYCSADLSLCFTSPIYGSEYAQKNVVFMGLSSGKISTSLKYGVPVIVNELGQISDYVREYNLGHVVESLSEINSILNNHRDESFSKRCTDFFTNKLDFSLFSDRFIKIIYDIIQNKPLQKEDVTEINKINACNFSLSHINQVKDNYNERLKMFISKEYQYGYKLYHPFDSLKKTKSDLKARIKKYIFQEVHCNNLKQIVGEL